MMFGTLFVVGFLFAGVWAGFAKLHPSWWSRRGVRGATWALLAAALLGTLLRSVARAGAGDGKSGSHAELAIVGVAVASPALIALFALFLSLPLAAALRGVGAAASRRVWPAATGERARTPPTLGDPALGDAALGDAALGDAALGDASANAATPTTASPLDRAAPAVGSPKADRGAAAPNGRIVVPRRPLLELATAAVPLTFLGAGAVGVAGALAATRVVPRPMRFADLHEDLVGLRVLHLTDLHVGAFMDLRGVEALVEAARPHAPDLVVLTGDVCDHLPWLAGTLRAVETLRPRVGILAALGNHEHFRGLGATMRGYGASGVDLLVDAGRTLRVGDATLQVVGVDDLARTRRVGHYEQAIARALDGAPSDAFRLGLCHRPSGFPDLARAGVDLTLSGHTHAGQVGLGGRSIFERVAPQAYLGGRYARGEAQLYTSTGGGHWFAFRLNCPSEAALITLERA